MAQAVGWLKICCRAQCDMAGVPQPISRFHKDKSARDGVHAYCKGCCRDYSRSQKARLAAYSKLWAKRDPIRRKAAGVRNNLVRLLRRLGREGEPTATTSEIESSLIAWIAEVGFPGRLENLRHIHCCHRIPLRRGGPCTADNLFWGWGELNVQAGWASPELVIRLVRDFLRRMESGQALPTLKTECMVAS